MASANKAILLGYLGRDPDVRVFADGNIVASASLATTEKYTNKSGELVQDTEWHKVVFRGRLAQIAEQWLHKGSLIYVEGSIKSRQYTTSQGVQKAVTEIIASKVQMCDRGAGAKTAGGQTSSQPVQPPQEMIDDNPFL